MAFTLPDLPYAHDALASLGMSKETLEFHHDLHHKAYVDNGNKLIAGTEWESKSLEDIVRGTYAAGAVALDLGAHLNEHFRQIGNFGFLRRIFQHGFAFGQRRRHQKIFRAGDGDHVGGDAGAAQAGATRRQFGHHVAMLDRNLRAHGLQTLDVLVHRP